MLALRRGHSPCRHHAQGEVASNKHRGLHELMVVMRMYRTAGCPLSGNNRMEQRRGLLRLCFCVL